MRLPIYGSSDFAQTAIEFVQACGHEPVNSADDMRHVPEILGSPEAVARSRPPGDYGIALAICYSMAGRWAAWQRACAAGYEALALIRPRAHVADSAHVSAGTMAMAGAVVDVPAKVDEASVLRTGVCVDHDTSIGANCFLSPNATVCGSALLGPNSFVGAGAAIADRREVPPSSFTKMLGRYTGRTV